LSWKNVAEQDLNGPPTAAAAAGCWPSPIRGMAGRGEAVADPVLSTAASATPATAADIRLIFTSTSIGCISDRIPEGQCGVKSMSFRYLNASLWSLFAWPIMAND
jgi:hypothetical protein